ncbi:ATP-binding protein [Sulfurimonas sp.]|nr:ATP-binding protein [Sulfurimonas sp.]
MRNKIGKYKSSISSLKLEERMLFCNTLILGEAGAGKTNLACRIRNYAIDSNIPTLYIDFSNSYEENIELRYKDKHFNYIRFEESEEFEQQLDKLIEDKKHIYMSVDSTYFSNKRDVRSQLTKTLQKQGFLDSYYYFFHDIENLEGFYTKFEDFLLYMLSFLNLKKYGLTFLAQPHPTFENPQVKLLFTFLYLGRCSNADYFNTARLKTLPKNRFFYQYRTDYRTLLFNDIKNNLVEVDEYIFQE